jgi:Bacterial regulatory helix-turn-helix protein, lysR family
MRGTRFGELSAFIAVADHGSFTKAAAQLGVSTSSLSQSVRSLEERLGVRLLNRTTRAAMLVYDRQVSFRTPAYFIALKFEGGRVVVIRDFLFARYAMDGVEMRPLA